jgi:DNA-binding CsgD family transcriptional regulator
VARSRQASLLDFVGEVEAAALSDHAQLLEVISDGLARLVPCDRAVCASWDPQARGTSSSDSELQAFRRAHIDLWNCWAQRQHPVVVYWANTKDGAAVRFSDLISRRALHRLPIYDYFWRPFGVEHNFGVRIEFARGRGVDLSCTRAHKDFSEDERDLVERLRPYLVRILRRTDAAPFAETLRARFGLSHREAEVLALVTRGKTNLETATTLFIAAGTVRKHLEHVYAKLGVTTRTQAAASP